MKKVLIILFILFSTNSFSQKWSLNKVDKNKEFGYEYLFSFQNENDKNEFIKTKNDNNKKSQIIGKILDKSNNPISGVVNISSKTIKFSKDIQTNFNGEFSADLDPGEYKLEINYIGFDKFVTEFSINEKNTIEFKIKLGLSSELRIYEINSKNELSDKEINQIIKCVEKNKELRNFSTEKCSDKLRYKVMIQI
ncbi:carboxypeptidase-like regulatory domain-containing protein [Lutibacter aestuarii]|uniref:Carboxypeptidase-like regulatory domain-containing protein n=1 Tax=Lutibacter aestuarii TaxID=861111 RepID=A0ABW2Z7K0_9FLAO